MVIHVVVLQRTAKKCTKNHNARAQPLLSSLNLLFSDVAVAVAVVLFSIKLPTCSIEGVTVVALTMIFSSSERIFSDYSRT